MVFSSQIYRTCPLAADCGQPCTYIPRFPTLSNNTSWMLGGGVWPNTGELDILEGVNQNPTNQLSAHTSSGCAISGAHSMAAMGSSNCDAAGDVGCWFGAHRTTSYRFQHSTLLEAVCMQFSGQKVGSASGSFNAGRSRPTSTTIIQIQLRGACQWPCKQFFYSPSALPPKLQAEAYILTIHLEGLLEHATLTSILSTCASCSTLTFVVRGRMAYGAAPDGMYLVPVLNKTDRRSAAKAATCGDWVANNPAAFQNAYFHINYLKVFYPLNLSGSAKFKALSQPPPPPPPTANATVTLAPVPTTPTAQTQLPSEPPVPSLAVLSPPLAMGGEHVVDNASAAAAAGFTPSASASSSPSPSAMRMRRS